jgi:ATP-dependent helicase/DNAse subunit B
MNAETPATIKFYRVPLNYRGSTELMFKEALRSVQPPHYSKIVYIAPTPRKIRDAEKIFFSLVESPYIPPRCYTLKQIAKQIFANEANGQFLPQVMVPLLLSHISGHGIGYADILSELLTELKQHHPLKDLALIHHELKEVFIRLGIPDDTLKRMSAALDIFIEYQSLISGHLYFDENDILNYRPSSAPRLMGKSAVLIVDGFYDMTAAEKTLLRELTKSAETALISYPYDINLSFIIADFVDYIKCNFKFIEESLEHSQTAESYIKYQGIEEEVEGVARTIKYLNKSNLLHASDWVVVACPRMSEYRELFERVFTRYGIPYTIALQRPTVQKGLFRDVLRLLESITEDFPRSNFTTVLRSPYFRNIPEIVKKNILTLSLASGIVKGKDSWDNIAVPENVKLDQRALRDALTWTFSVLDKLITVRSSSVPDSISTLIEETFTELGLEGAQDDIEVLNDSLNKIGIVCRLSGKKYIHLREYTEFLRYILSTAEYRQEEQGIQIMEFLETRGLEPDYLFFCGLKDGAIPEKPPVDHILPDTVRTEYGLVNLNMYLSVQKLNFMRIIGGSKHVYLSYHEMDGDKLFLPSSYLPLGSAIPANQALRRITGIFSREELLIRKGGKKLSEMINQIVLDTKTSEKILKTGLASPFRVTDIDYFRRCPRRYFIEKVLRLESAEIFEYEIEPKLLGTIIHRFMEELLKKPLEDPTSVQEEASYMTEKVLREYHVEGYLKKLIKASFLEIIPKIFELESGFRDEGFVPYKLEMNITEEVLPGIALKGKIDRIDYKNELFRILDYKTGSSTVGSEMITKGKGLQIPLYAAMIKARGMSVEKAGIYALKDVAVKWIPTKKDKNILEDYITSARKYLVETVAQIRKGNFDARPMDDFYCTSCPESPFCPYIHAKGSNTDE